MRRLWNTYRAWIVAGYLYDLHAYAQGRIDAGDLDFDDTVYRTRDATAELLDLRA